jgi:DNA-binding PadR family transcriptional regulator
MASIMNSVKSETTLSRTALLILGIIGQAPINPYAIISIVNQRRRNLRRRTHAQTVYGIINNLASKKLIAGEKMTNGKMPNKTVYSITEKGKELLQHNVLSYISTPESNLTELALSMMLVGYLDKEIVLKALKEYRSKAKEEIALRKKLGSSEISEDVYIGKIAVEHTLKILEVNLDTVNKLIKRIEQDTQWANLDVPWWRDQYLQD